MILRPYQESAVQSVLDEFEVVRRTLCVMPTGTGKTVVMGGVARRMNARTLVVAHREELVNQNAEKIAAITGNHAHIEMADDMVDALFLGSARLVSASVQSLSAKKGPLRRMHRFPRDAFDLVMIDEAHHATANTWSMLIEYFSHAKVLGVTATPQRADGVALGTVFESTACEYWINDAIDDGWLVPMRFRRCKLKSIDFSGIHDRKGDYSDAELDQIMREEKGLIELADGIFQHHEDRPTIVYVPGVGTAIKVAEILNRMGGDGDWAAVVHAGTDIDLRRHAMSRFADGRLRFLVNVGIATEGVDLPVCSCIAVARPTKSALLFTQMIGRATRPSPGTVDGIEDAQARRSAIAASAKPDSIVLEFVGNLPSPVISLIDVLGGRIRPRVLERARRIIESSDGLIDPRKVLEYCAEQERLAEEKRQRERDAAARRLELETDRERERERRRHIYAHGTWHAFDHDPFSVLGIAKPAPDPHEATGIYAAAPLSEQQLAMLERARVRSIRKMPVHEQRAILRNYIHRLKGRLWTFSQEVFLRAAGCPLKSMPFRKASEAIDLLKRNPGKRWHDLRLDTLFGGVKVNPDKAGQRKGSDGQKRRLARKYGGTWRLE